MLLKNFSPGVWPVLGRMIGIDPGFVPAWITDLHEKMDVLTDGAGRYA